MAEPTIQIGGGNWAGKTDNLLGYYKEGERFYKQDFTFSRSTTGTYTDSDGYIQEMPYNEVTYSEQFDNGAWTKSGTTIIANDTTSPDGTINADKIYPTSSGNYRHIRTSLLNPTSGLYTFSIYAKKAELDHLVLLDYDGSGVGVDFDLTNGVATDNASTAFDSVEMIDVGNGWYRCIATATNMYFYWIVSDNGGLSVTSSGTSGLYIWGGQAVKGTSAKTYFPTTTRLNMPRVDYLNNSNGSLILEPQRTNLLPYSDLSSGFTTTNVTLSNNQGTSPDGTSNATKALMASGTGTHRVYDAINSSINDDNVLSVFIKEQNDITHIGLAADTMSGVCWFSGSDGSIINANGLDAKTESFGNGWHRISVYYVADANDAGDNQFIYFSNRENPSPNVPFDGTEEILLYGIQAEKGSYATTLINTLGSSVTRNQDTCTDGGDASRFNDNEGVLFFEAARLNEADNSSIIWSISDGSNSNAVSLYYYSSGIGVDIFNTLGTKSLSYTMTLNQQATFNKLAIKYKSNDIALWVNGSEVATNTDAISLSGLNQLMASYGSGSFPFYGNVKQLQVYNTALTDSELATLTTL